MSGALIAAATGVGNPLPAWANISGPQAGTSNADKTMLGPATITLSWNDVTITMTFVVNGSNAASGATGVSQAVNNGDTVHFLATCSRSTGPVTMTASAPGRASATFTVTMT